MPSIARKNLLEDIPRFLVAQAGIMFAVTLVTIQVGILKGFSRSTVLLIEGSVADIWIASEQMVHFELTDPLIADSVNQVRLIPGVESAEALILGSGQWLPPEGEISPVKLVGFEPKGRLFQPGRVIEGNVTDLVKPYQVMADQSRMVSLAVNKIGDRSVIRGLPVELAGITSESQSLVASSFLFTSLENAKLYINASFTSRIDCKIAPDQQLKCITVFEQVEPDPETTNLTPQPLTSADPITYILVKAKLGQDLQQLKNLLNAAIPGTIAYTREEMSRKTQDYWLMRTGLGFIFGLGAAVGVIVGMVVVSQILYSSVSDHIKEFGTLKAMGASNRVIYQIILEQATWMAILGYIPGILVCWGVSIWATTKGVIILITPLSAVGVLGVTLIMCIGSAFFAIQKVTRIDPAIVFKA
jgi:putative ABC transport system permease protein